jgi:excinuclease ABC subunit B
MEAAYPMPSKGRYALAERSADYRTMSPEQLIKRAAQLEKQMLRHARDLEFEAAAKLRDEIRELRQIGLGVASRKAG